MIMSKRTKSFLFAFIVTMLFLLLTAFSSSSVFNLLPYMLHESFSSGGAGETNFIVGFDIVFSLLLFYIVYRATKCVLSRKQA
jgi:hypothetical protein